MNDEWDWSHIALVIVVGAIMMTTFYFIHRSDQRTIARLERFKAEHHCVLASLSTNGSRMYHCDNGLYLHTRERGL